MTAADIYRSHVFCNAYCTSFFEKTIDKSASFDIIDSVPNELNIWGYSSAGRALEWHSRGQRFDPAYLHQNNNSHSQCCVSYCFIQEEYEDEHSVKRCVPKPVQKMHGLFLFSMK